MKAWALISSRGGGIIIKFNDEKRKQISPNRLMMICVRRTLFRLLGEIACQFSVEATPSISPLQLVVA